MNVQRIGRLGGPVKGIFHTVELKAGQVWRKFGPADWLRIRVICLPGYEGYDGGAPGVFVDFRTDGGRWQQGNGGFYAVDSMEEMIEFLRDQIVFQRTKELPASGPLRCVARSPTNVNKRKLHSLAICSRSYTNRATCRRLLRKRMG